MRQGRCDKGLDRLEVCISNLASVVVAQPVERSPDLLRWLHFSVNNSTGQWIYPTTLYSYTLQRFCIITVIYPPRPPPPPRHARRPPLIQRCRVRVQPRIIIVHPAICHPVSQHPPSNRTRQPLTGVHHPRGDPAAHQVRPPILRLDERPAGLECKCEVAATPHAQSASTLPCTQREHPT